MWPIYVLLSKFLGAEEDNTEESGRDRLSLVESLLFKRSLGREKYHGTVSGSYFEDVPHINQLHSWDCGLACVLMVLRTLGINDCNLQELEELCCTTRRTTKLQQYLDSRSGIFIAEIFCQFFLLHSNFRCKSKFLCGDILQATAADVRKDITPALVGGLLHEIWEQLPNDIVRVDMLFRKARDAGISIQCRSISSEEISILILSGKFLAIALVDQYKLSHSWLDVCASDLCNDTPNYTGHYILICGYDTDSDEFEIRDPASSRKYGKVTSKCLEKARKSFGTDEDLLLIRIEREET